MSTIQTTREMTAGRRIELRDIYKEFGDLVAVDGIDVTIDPGELLVLLGPSGCGKSTTLRMIAGLEVPTSGTVHIGDRDVTNETAQNRDVSMVFQDYALYPHKTVRGNLRFPLDKMDLSEAEKDERIADVAEMLEITDLLDKQPGALSGGQKQRVALGRTIVSEPSVYLMDEPLANLDQQLRIHARAEIRDLQQRLETTMVYVTHDQEEAMSIADRLAVMRNGQVEQIGTPEEVYRDPVNEFVAGFLGEPEMNFIQVEDDPDVTAAMLDGEADSAVSTVGIRPHDVYLASTASETQEFGSMSEPFTVTVGVFEPLGDVYEVNVVRDDLEITVELRTLPEGTAMGDELDLVVDRDELYYFDDSGTAIQEVS